MQTNISIKYIITILISVIIGGAATYGFFLNKNNLEQITNESVSHLQENKKTSIWQVTKEDRSEEGNSYWDEEAALSKVIPTPKEGIQVTEKNKDELAKSLGLGEPEEYVSNPGDQLLYVYNLYKQNKDGYIKICYAMSGDEYWYEFSDGKYTAGKVEAPGGDMVPTKIIEKNDIENPLRISEKYGFEINDDCSLIYLSPNNPWGLGGINKYNFK
jgi:hypothetical protein